jgi:hypothetical protein
MKGFGLTTLLADWERPEAEELRPEAEAMGSAGEWEKSDRPVSPGCLVEVMGRKKMISEEGQQTDDAQPPVTA